MARTPPPTATFAPSRHSRFCIHATVWRSYMTEAEPWVLHSPHGVGLLHEADDALGGFRPIS